MKLTITHLNLNKRDVPRNVELALIEYLVSSILVISKDLKTSFSTYEDIQNLIVELEEKLETDRMRSEYTDDLIKSTIGIISNLISSTMSDTIKYTIHDYTMSIMEMTRLSIIIQILVDNEAI